MMQSNRTHSLLGVHRMSQAFMLAVMMAVTPVSVSFACNGGGGGGGGGSSGGGSGDGGEDHEDATTTGDGTTAPGGFEPTTTVTLPGGRPGGSVGPSPGGSSGGYTFMGVRIPADFPSGDCTSRTADRIESIQSVETALSGGTPSQPQQPQGSVPELRESFSDFQTDEQRATELENIRNALSHSQLGQRFIDDARGTVPNVAGVRGVEPVRQAMANAQLNALAEQIQRRNDIVKERNNIVDAIRSEIRGGSPDNGRVRQLEDRLNESNAGVAVQESRIRNTIVGTRSRAEDVAEAQRRADVFVGGLTVSFLGNIAAGGAGSLARSAGASTADAFGASLATGTVINYATGRASGGSHDAGARSVASNAIASVVVEALSPPGANIVGQALASAATQAAVEAAVDEANKRDGAHRYR